MCLSGSVGLLNRGPGAQLSAEGLFSLLELEHCLKLRTATDQTPPLGAILSTTFYLQLSQTSCAPIYIIVLRPLNHFP